MNAANGYARSGSSYIAYSVTGDGPIDVLNLSTYTLSIDSLDEEPHAAHYFRRLASFSRLVRFDLRGIGLSDPMDVESPMTFETYAADALAVLDAVGIERAAVIADTGGGLAAIELAARHPDRVSALVLVNAYAFLVADEDNAAGHPRSLLEGFLEQNTDPGTDWSAGDADDLALIAPSLQHDQRTREWWYASLRTRREPGFGPGDAPDDVVLGRARSACRRLRADPGAPSPRQPVRPGRASAAYARLGTSKARWLRRASRR